MIKFSSISIAVLQLLMATTVMAGDVAPHGLLSAAGPAQLVQAAVRYEHGEGLPRDIDTAVRLYCRAARAGSADAQYRLGWIYANGRI